MTHFAGADVLRFDADADFHGGSARVVDAGVEGYQVADVYRLFKQDFIDRLTPLRTPFIDRGKMT